MSNFIDNNTTITANVPKVDIKPIVGLAVNNLQDVEINAMLQAAYDTRTVILRRTSIMSYGADATGATDCSSAFTAAIAALSSGGTLHLPKGTYLLAVNTTIPSNVALEFDSSTISINNGVTLTINGDVISPAVQIFTYASSPSAQPVVFGSTSTARVVDAWFDSQGFRSSWTGALPSTLRTLRSIAELRNAPITPNEPVRVLGYATPGDGGDGVFHWTSTIPNTGLYQLDDNVGIVITSSVAGASGRWRREGFMLQTNGSSQAYETTSGRINARWFGAVPDGLTDNHTAIQGALNAAAYISQVNSEFTNKAPSGTTLYYGGGCTVYLPAGTYAIGSTIECTYGVNLEGDEATALIPTSGVARTLTMLRTPGCCNIRGISFQGGLNAIALGGQAISPLWTQSDGSQGFYSPIYIGQPPLNIDRCQFMLQYGPSIWQDGGPGTLVNGSQTLVAGTPSTLNVVNSASFKHVLGNQIQIISADGTTAWLCTYTGVGTGTLLGVNYVSTITRNVTSTPSAGTTITVANSLTVTVNDYNRDTQVFVNVSNFLFQGPHLFYGTGDTIQFNHGIMMPDTVSLTDSGSPNFPGYQTYTDGTPLGLFNTNGVLNLDNLAMDPNTDSYPARYSVICGAGELSIANCHSTDAGGYPTFRLKTLTTAWQGNGLVPFLGQGAGIPATVGATLTVINSPMINATHSYWLECHDLVPGSITLKLQAAGTFVFTYGIWFDSSLNLQNLLQGQQASPDASSTTCQMDAYSCTGYLNSYYAFQARQGNDPGNSAAPGATAGTDVASLLIPYVERPLRGMAPAVQLEEQNLLTTAYDIATVAYLNAPNGSSTTDTSTGRTLTGRTGQSFIDCKTEAIPASPSTSPLPAGIYCFSLFVKVTQDCDVYLNMAYSDGNDSPLGTQRVFASDSFQRISVPFYFPGGNLTMQPGCSIYATVTSVFFAYFQINKGSTPSKYIFPGNSSALVLGRIPSDYYASSIPTTGNFIVGDRVWNTAASAGGVGVWVCTTAGSTGTFVFKPLTLGS